MHGGFCSLVNPATRIDQIDVEGTRAERERLRELCRQRELAREELDAAPIDERAAERE